MIWQGIKKSKDEKHIESVLSNLEKLYKPSNIKMIALLWVTVI